MSQEADVTIVTKDATYAKVLCESGTLFELSDQFTFEVPGAKFSPAYKNGKWDGRKHLLSQLNRQMYHGLIPDLIEYCNDAGYTVADKREFTKPKVDYATIEKFCLALNLYSRGEKIDIRPYQIEAIYESILNSRMTLLSPTSSGKSLIAYCIIRWFILTKQKILLLVPNIGLVAQMYKDFDDYSSHNGWNVKTHTHCVSAGITKTTDKLITISTWQSLYNIGRGTKKGGQLQADVPANFFEHFDVVICDEVHTAKAASITGIMERATNANKRIGMTGTLDGVDVNKLVIQGLFGPVMIVTTTAELMENGDVTKLAIKCLKLNYPPEVKKDASKLTFQEEIDYLITEPNRNRFIAKLALSQTENVIVFFTKQEHGRTLVKMLTEMADGKKKILHIDGNVELDKREDIRQLIATRNDLILVGSYGCLSTGSNMPNLHVGIFGSPNKSKIRTLQSIGRLLRLNTGKILCTLYDIFDDMCHKKKKNFSFEWFIERVSYYAEQKFKYKIIDIPVEILR